MTVHLVGVEAFIIPFIQSKVGGVKVGTKIPNPRPDEFVRAWVNGGAAINRILERVQVTVDCWAPSTTDASDLADTVRNAFLGDHIHNLVRGVEEITRPYSQPDETSERYRATYALLVRGHRSTTSP